MTKIFAKANLDWLDNDFFTKELNQNNTGQNIAILKTYIAIVLESDFSTRKVKISYTKLENITGLSRPLIAYSLKRLIEKNLICVLKTNRGATNIYKINDEDKKGWAKIPYSAYSVLEKLSNRNTLTLGALKIFLVLLRYRNNKFDITFISVKKLRDKTNLQNNKITNCRDILINHNLLQFGRVIEENGIYTKRPNLYYIVGIHGKREQKMLTSDEIKSICVTAKKEFEFEEE